MRHYLTDEECKEYGLPLGTYLGDSSDETPAPTASQFCDDPAAYEDS